MHPGSGQRITNNNQKLEKMAVEIKDSNFEEMVLNGDKKVAVLDFWAEWCGPCKMIAPVIERLSEKYGDKALIGKVNVDENPDISVRYRIRNIPTVLFIKDGEVVDKQVGAGPEKLFEDKLTKLL